MITELSFRVCWKVFANTGTVFISLGSEAKRGQLLTSWELDVIRHKLMFGSTSVSSLLLSFSSLIIFQSNTLHKAFISLPFTERDVFRDEPYSCCLVKHPNEYTTSECLYVRPSLSSVIVALKEKKQRTNFTSFYSSSCCSKTIWLSLSCCCEHKRRYLEKKDLSIQWKSIGTKPKLDAIDFQCMDK